MFVFNIEDPNEGLGTVITALKKDGITSASRNGPVVRFPRPVCLQYDNPRRRLLTSAVRDANPTFHLFETVWMFAGLSEIQPLLTYNAGMAQYSDDGRNLRGTAYGHRWRSMPDWGDQILTAVAALRKNPDDRRVVMSMWHPEELGAEGKDFACNLQVIFSTRPGGCEHEKHTLDMTVTNRSNDLIYGAMGSNMFHFSMLLEYVALLTGLRVGTYYQVSANLHLYTENETSARCWDNVKDLVPDEVSQMTDPTLTEVGMTSSKEVLAAYIRNRDTKCGDQYVQQVLSPLVEAYHVFKLKSRLDIDLPAAQRVAMARGLAAQCASPALRGAVDGWLARRVPKPSTAPGDALRELLEANRRGGQIAAPAHPGFTYINNGSPLSEWRSFPDSTEINGGRIK